MKDPPFVFHLRKNCEKKRLYSIIENKKAIVAPTSDGTLRASSALLGSSYRVIKMDWP